MSDTDDQPQEQPKETTMFGADSPRFEVPPQASPQDTSIGITRFQLTQAVSLIYAPTNHISPKNSPPALSR